MNTIKGVPEMLTPAEFALQAKIPVKTVRAMIRIGAIKVRRFGPRLARILPEEALRVMRTPGCSR